MSKTANLTTLRKKQNFLKLIDINQNFYLKHLNFLKIFIFFLQKKGIWVVSSFLNLNININKFYLTIFFSTKKIRTFRSNIKPKLEDSISTPLSVKNLSKLFLTLFQNSVTYLVIRNLNNKINKQFLNDLNKKLKKYKSFLFQRRLNFYFDTLKIITLFSQKLINTNFFVYLLSLIFKHLSKKLHGKFILFLETVIYSLVYNPFIKDRRAKNSLGKLKGIKFRINGKLKGKMRASTHLITYGTIPNQSIDNNIEYSMVHSYTRYGVFGFQAWIFK